MGKNSEQVSVRTWIACVTREGRVARVSHVTLAFSRPLKALVNEDTSLPTQMFPRLSAHATFVADTKNFSDFVQKHFVTATNVSQFINSACSLLE